MAEGLMPFLGGPFIMALKYLWGDYQENDDW